ncbi:MAG: hypothetical protein F9K29_07530 [Hyphomicrobiaceae bacterium]|nr:MAG: hypothetical protein F9K29_07530 [Hyphomicrobiaceae bacterium]
MAVGNLVWEIAQFPLYTIWRDGTRDHLLLALMHGPVGDMFIAAAALMAALAIFGDSRWPNAAFLRVAAAAVVFGLAYTIYSEWMHVEVRHTWTYSELMPRVPPLGTGLSPLLQWPVVPILALGAARTCSSAR